jgi:alcohol dehydrogenase (NADP+)
MYKTLSNGMKIPAIGFGTFGSDRFSHRQVADAVEGAIQAGYRLFDCAAVYGNEDVIGGVFARCGVKRDELFITSKVWNDMHKWDNVFLSCHRSLKDLQLDYIDCYFIHWPFRNYHAPGCDGDARNPDSRPFYWEEYMETWGKMERLYDMGLIKSIGMSNMTVPKLDAVLKHCRVKPAAIEMELHPAFQQPALFDYCMGKNIQPIGFCPIGSPTRPERDKSPDDIAATEMPEIVAIAEAHNVHPAIICLKWAAQRGQIPIPFSVNPYEYESNLRCLSTPPLSEAEMQTIAGADKNCRLVKGQVFLWESAEDWRALWDEPS